MELQISGNDLRLVRLSRRLRQVDVARVLGLSRERIGQIEAKEEPSPRLVARYLAAITRTQT